jgi:hypothetical protein
MILTNVGSVTLPEPRTDETIDHDKFTVSRQTRGKRLRQLDAWGTNETVSATFTVLTEDEADDLKTFLSNNVGSPITVSDSVITGTYYIADTVYYCAKDGCSYSCTLTMNRLL